MRTNHCHACHGVFLCFKSRNPSFLEWESLRFEPSERERSPAALPVCTKPCLVVAQALNSRLVPSLLQVRGLFCCWGLMLALALRPLTEGIQAA